MSTPTSIAAAFVLVSLITQHARAQQAPSPIAQPRDQSQSQPQPTPQQPTTWQDLQKKVEAEESAIETRRKRIEEELKVPAADPPAWASEWAGTYYTGDGLGMNVRISLAPKAGLTYTWHGCMGLYDANHGDITESFDGGIKVKLVIDEAASSYKYMSSTLYFVKLGERRYLVPEAKMMDLVNNYNQSGYARSGMFSIPRKEDADKPRPRFSDNTDPDGKPQLPERWAKLLLDKPITFKVTAVRDRTSRTVTGDVLTCIAQIDLNKGSKEFVTVGMEILYSVGWERGTITIDKVDEHSCTGTFRTYGDKKSLLEPPPVGTVISSNVGDQIGIKQPESK